MQLESFVFNKICIVNVKKNTVLYIQGWQMNVFLILFNYITEHSYVFLFY